MLARLALLLAVALGGCTASRTVADGRIRASNIGVTAIATLASRAAQGKLRSSEDVATALGAGALSGLGFYHSKALAARGRFGTALALSYASASIAENAAEGEHILGAVRYGFGPLDVRLRTPLSRRDRPPAVLEVNAASAVTMAALPILGYRPDLEAGALVFRGDGRSTETGPDRIGFAIGRTVGLDTDRADVVAHEMVHAVQSFQVGAVTPGYRVALEVGPVPVAVQVDWGLASTGALHVIVPYENRWTEVEAFSVVPEDPCAGACPAQIGTAPAGVSRGR